MLELSMHVKVLSITGVCGDLQKSFKEKLALSN